MTVPIGTILPYGGSVEGSAKGQLDRQGWLVCDGEPVDRDEYSDLYDVIGGFFGDGDNVSTFNLPDLRGRFVRGVDAGKGRDPDASSRKASDTGGNTGDRVGSVQEDKNKSHKHEYFDESQRILGVSSPGSELNLESQKQQADPNYKAGDSAIEDPPNFLFAVQLSPAPSPSRLIDKFAKRDTSTNDGKETRPKNIYVNWIIKAKNV